MAVEIEKAAVEVGVLLADGGWEYLTAGTIIGTHHILTCAFPEPERGYWVRRADGTSCPVQKAHHCGKAVMVLLTQQEVGVVSPTLQRFGFCALRSGDVWQVSSSETVVSGQLPTQRPEDAVVDLVVLNNPPTLPCGAAVWVEEQIIGVVCDDGTVVSTRGFAFAPALQVALTVQNAQWERHIEAFWDRKTVASALLSADRALHEALSQVLLGHPGGSHEDLAAELVFGERSVWKVLKKTPKTIRTEFAGMLKEILLVLLPHSSEWTPKTIEVRTSLANGHQVVELNFAVEAKAEAVMAGVDGRASRFIVKQENPRLIGEYMRPLPLAYNTPIARNPSTCRDDVVKLLLAEAPVSNASDGLAGLVEAWLEDEVDDKLRRYLLFVDVMFPGGKSADSTAMWNNIKIGLQDLPSLPLVRLEGDTTVQTGEIWLPNRLLKILENA